MALGQYRKILQIVGYQNSGKTTLMEQLIKQATMEGLRVGTIKHHGHGGVPTIETSKDSSRHEQAGAVVTAVEGAGTLRMSIHQNSWQLIGIVGGIVIGTAAVQAGITSNILLIIIALSALASFTSPSYMMGNVIRLIRFPINCQLNQHQWGCNKSDNDCWCDRNNGS